jgi:hypothetical protein
MQILKVIKHEIRPAIMIVRINLPLKELNSVKISLEITSAPSAGNFEGIVLLNRIGRDSV